MWGSPHASLLIDAEGGGLPTGQPVVRDRRTRSPEAAAMSMLANVGPLGLSAVMFSYVGGQAQVARFYPDTRENHWVYDGLKRMKAEGLIDDPNLRGGLGPSTRGELALDVQAGYDGVRRSVERLELHVKGANLLIAKYAARRSNEIASLEGQDLTEARALVSALSELLDEAKGCKSYSGDVSDLRRLVYEFGPEMATQRIDPKTVARGLADLNHRISHIVVTKRG